MPAPSSPRPATRWPETRYPWQHLACLSPKVDDQIETLRDLHETAKGVMLRRVIERDLPIVKSALANERMRAANVAAKGAQGSA